MVPSIVAEDGIALGVYCRLAGGQPIHFGREDGVERTLLRVACQSETFLASPWQGDASIRFVGHIGCQSDFDELVSMAFPSGRSWFLSDGRDKSAVLSGEKPFWPEEKHLNDVSSTERRVWPDESANR